MTEITEANKIYYGPTAVDAVYSGPTLVWPIFQPTNISGCVLWMDASQLTGADGSSVTTWPNLADASKTLSIEGTPVPTIRANALNGLRVVKQTGGSSRFKNAVSMGFDTDYTFMFIARRWSLTKVGRAFGSDYSAGTANNLYGWWDQYENCAHNSGASWLGNGITAGGPIAGHTMDWRLFSGDASSSTPSRLFSNGVLQRTGVSPATVGFQNTLLLGGFNSAGRTEEPDTEYAEIIVYNRKLSDAERKSAENYLRKKWHAPEYWHPTDLGQNLYGWFDATDTITFTFDAGIFVRDWRNKGVTSMALGQSVTNDQPMRFSNEINFISSASRLVAANVPAPFDILVLGTSNITTSDWRTLLRGPTGAHHIIVEMGSYRVGTYNGGFFPAGTLTWNGTQAMLYARFGASPVDMSFNGQPFVSTGTTIAAGDIPFVSFGAYQGPPISQGFGRVNEVFYVPYTSSTDTRQKLEGYLAWKWGIQSSLPFSHPYRFTQLQGWY